MKINLDFINKHEIKAGSLLISNPILVDGIFHRSVVLLCEHNNYGTLGFILNKESDVDVSEAFSYLANYNIFYGGPVNQDEMYILHQMSVVPESVHLRDNLYFGGDITSLPDIEVPIKSDTDIKFMLGFASWEPGQLYDEISEQSWIVLNDFDIDFIFNTPSKKLWKECLRLLGEDYMAFINYPSNPMMN